MVRPNGSVIGRNSKSGELNEDPLIHGALHRCLVRRGPRHLSSPRPQCRHVATRLQSAALGCSASNQRVGCGGGGGGGGAADGFGNGEPAAAGAAAALGGFGFFGRISLRTARGGGPAGLSSANTGLGSVVVVAGLAKSPGLRITCTGTVTGWNLGRAKVTEKPLSGAGTATEQ